MNQQIKIKNLVIHELRFHKYLKDKTTTKEPHI